MADYYHIASKNVLGLRTNLPTFKWSFGVHTSPATKDAYDACRLRLRVRIGDPDESVDVNGLQKYHYFKGLPGGDELYYMRRFMLGSWLRLHARGLLTEEPTITANGNYARFIKHRFMNLHSLPYILTDLAAILLLRRGYAALHCSAFHKNGATVVVFAPPNGGKTLTTMTACMKHGAEFLAEDLAVTDGTRIHSVPGTSTFRYYGDVDASLGSRVLNRLTRMFPPFELFSIGSTKRVEEFLGRCNIRDCADITHVVLLERGDSSVSRASSEECLRKIVNLNRYEFNYLKAPMLVANEFFNPELSLDAAQSQERTILQRMVDGAERLTISTSDATRYVDMLLDAIE